MAKGRKPCNLVNKTFGAITVLERVTGPNKHESYWRCKCICGEVAIRSAGNIKRSTGCASCAQKLVKPNKSGSNLKEYDCWRQIKRRCYITSDPGYKYYGARGIKMCSEWFESFWAFYKDLGSCPNGFSIERKDVDKDYCSENCCWIPKKLQARNRRSSVWITLGGRTLLLQDWMIEFKMSSGVYYRRRAQGWSAEKALVTPIKSRK